MQKPDRIVDALEQMAQRDPYRVAWTSPHGDTFSAAQMLGLRDAEDERWTMFRADLDAEALQVLVVHGGKRRTDINRRLLLSERDKARSLVKSGLVATVSVLILLSGATLHQGVLPQSWLNFFSFEVMAGALGYCIGSILHFDRFAESLTRILQGRERA